MRKHITDQAVLGHARRDAVAIRQSLRATETAGDELLFASFELGKRMLTARRNPGVVPHTGQTAIIRLLDAQRAIVEATNDIFRIHDELGAIGIATGVMDEPGTTPTSALGTPAEDAATAGRDCVEQT